MVLKKPHLLLASSNSRKLLSEIRHIIGQQAIEAIESEIENNVKLLFILGESHYEFARQLNRIHWRQRISRFYYGAYNIRRALNLYNDGSFSTESSDHKKTELPSNLNNSATYQTRLHDLRADRNLADYDHTAVETDLIITQDEVELFVTNFIQDSRIFLTSQGLTL